MNIAEIKVRLENLQNGKTVKKFPTMDFATQYAMDYNLDVTYLLSIIEKCLEYEKYASCNFCGGGIERICNNQLPIEE